MNLKIKKVISVFLINTMLWQIFSPSIAWALTDGPQNPESFSFSPTGNKDMVNLFTGDFNYSIPLMDVGGYPISLTYNSNPTMEQEASWVGLGWTLNTGAINRELRGLPDDFRGDSVIKEMSIKDNITYGAEIGHKAEFSGMFIPPVPGFKYGVGLTVFKNSYKGLGLSLCSTIEGCASLGKEGNTEALGKLGLNASSQDGVSISPALRVKEGGGAAEIGATFNSREGLKELNFSSSNSILKSAQYSFSNRTYTPKISMQTKSLNTSLKIAFGPDVFLLFGAVSLKGFYNTYGLVSHNQIVPAYGYKYEEASGNNNRILQDFNRENDGTNSAHIPILPLPIHTNDIYSVDANGMNFQFRQFRGDVGVLHDQEMASSSGSADLGGEFGYGNLVKAGIDISGMLSFTKTNEWKDNNAANPYVSFKNPQLLQASIFDYEPSYYKKVGDFVSLDKDFISNIGNFNTARVKLNHNGVLNGISGATENKLEVFDRNNAKLPDNIIASQVVRKIRDIRSTQIQGLTIAETRMLGGIHWIYPKQPLYTSNLYYYLQGKDFSSFVGQPLLNRKDHHIGEYIITNTDGSRYYYGLPVYNLKQEEVTFAVANTTRPFDGLVAYCDEDNSIDNKKGLDNFYSKQTIPAYVTSHLLTAVVSPDYEDLSNDGPTGDDKGTWTKFSYSLVNNNFKWRMPFDNHKASFNEGLAFDDTDDKGSYVYGEKEKWVISSIENSDLIAYFLLSDQTRLDGAGVMNTNGGLNNGSFSPILSEIRLYSKASLVKDRQNAKPIKVVHLEYSYELCKGVKNAVLPIVNGIQTGKLTLTGLYFTFGDNTKGSLNKYKFDYANSPDYNSQKVDRWGNYKDYAGSNIPQPSIFPYVYQNKLQADIDAASWNLNQITLPSGSIIKVNYESDDYAYVQDKRACQMYLVSGIGNSANFSQSNSNLYDGINSPRNYIFITVPEPVTSKADIYNKYLQGLEYLYCHFAVKLKKGSDITEPISVYGKILDYYYDSNHTNMICVEIQSVKVKGGYANPVSKSAWQLIRNELPNLTNPGSINTNNNLLLALRALIGSITSIGQIFNGFDKHAATVEFGKQIDPSESWVRCLNSNFKKLGGGSRVKSIIVSDNWATQTNNGENTSELKTEYIYTKKEIINGVEQEISSGVGSYEPNIGGDENPFKQPYIYTSNSQVLGYNEKSFIETPMGESYFPSPSIGYSQVIVKSVNANNNNTLNNGWEVYCYYTTKDFPNIVSFTDIDNLKFHPPATLSLLLNLSLDYKTLSQGYNIETNDMNGKLLSYFNYNESGRIVNGKINKYKEKLNEQGKRVLDNEVYVCDGTETVDLASIGAEVDMAIDMRQQKSIASSLGADINMDVTVIPFIPPFALTSFTIYPNFYFDFTRFRSTVANKTINRHGILEEIITFKDGAQYSQKNLVFDKVNGEPILNSVVDEYGDKIYNMNYPAWWIYDNLGPSYKNEGCTYNFTSILNGVPVSNNISNLCDGDVLMPSSSSDFEKIIGQYSNQSSSQLYSWGSLNQFWVSTRNSHLVILDEQGNPLNCTVPVSLKVLRSGRHNQTSFSTGNIVCYDKNPFNSSTLKWDFSSLKIKSATLTSYKDEWQLDCRSISSKKSITTNLTWPCFENFLNGLMALWNNSFQNANGFNIFYNTPAQPISIQNIIGNSCSIKLSNVSLDSLFFQPVVTNFSITNSPYVALLGPNCYLLINSPLNVPINWADHNYVDSTKIKNTQNPNVYVLIDSTGRELLTFTLIYSSNQYQCNEYCVNGNPFNPYRLGVLNNWKGEGTYTLNEQNEYDNLNITAKYSGYHNGIINSIPYNYSNNKWIPNILNKNKWIKSDLLSKVNSRGKEIETKNLLDKNSCVLFNNGSDLPLLTSKNAAYEEVYFSGFEQIKGFYDQNWCTGERWTNEPSLGLDITNIVSHTGLHSYKLDNSSLVYTTDIKNVIANTYMFDNTRNIYTTTSGTCLPLVAPLKDKKYVASFWIYKPVLCDNTVYTVANSAVILGVGGAPIPFVAKSPKIDGWQLFECQFSYSNNITKWSVIIDSDDECYIDDFRIAPLISDTKSYVFNEFTLKLSAVLDNNHYATKYEYDEEGVLVRTKKETSKGIVTLNETRKNLAK